MNSHPVAYPEERGTTSTTMSVGFWYKHEANANTETVVVLMRNPPRNRRALEWQIEDIADRLVEILKKQTLLPTLFEYGGR
jgi:hypothetical protein